MPENTHPRTQRPNIIWLFGDQHRAQAMGCAGNTQISTPNIDALAAEGVYFRRAVSGCPWCTPFRGSLLTGRYPQHCVVRTPQVMDPTIPTIAHAFSSAGYETAYFGKWHLAWDKSMPVPKIDGKPRHDAIPVPREMRGGFDTWVGYNNGNTMFHIFLQGHTANGDEVPPYRTEGYETDRLTDLLIDFFRARARFPEPKRRPFFAALSVEPPHSPYVAPEEWMARHKPEDIELPPNVPRIEWMQKAARQSLAGYYAMIENLDHNVGRVLSALEASGLSDNTYVVFFSDHGDQHWSHGYTGKSQPWEESIRIPFVVGGGAVKRDVSGRQVDAVLNTVDIAPTTLQLCGLDAPGGMPGFDYSPYVTQPDAPEPLPNEPDSALLQHLVRKLHNHTMNCTWRGLATRDGWKYFCTERAGLGMFDLNEDPFEQHNLVFKQAAKDKRREIIERLGRWIVETGDTYPLPDPD